MRLSKLSIANVAVATVTGADDTSMNKQWERNTSDNVNRTTTTHTVDRAGRTS